MEIAEVAAVLPVSNAWPERGNSTLKLIKTRLRSSMKNDMLSAIMHVSINGPSSDECTPLVKKAVKAWLARKSRRKIQSTTVTKVVQLQASLVETDPAEADEEDQVQIALDRLNLLGKDIDCCSSDESDSETDNLDDYL